MLLFGLFIVSYWILKTGMGKGLFGGPSQSNIEYMYQNQLTFSRAYIEETTVPVSDNLKLLNTWVTRIFTAIVLQCVAIYLISQFPGFKSPFWLGIVLQFYTYGSAYIFYASSWDDQSEQI